MKYQVLPRYAILLLLLVTLVVYGNTFVNQWSYDDVPVVVQNPDSHSIAGFLENSRPGRPLRELTYIPEYRLFGTNPAGYHVQQLAWHAANGILVFVLFTSLGLDAFYALFGAVLFLVHPLQSESVANIANRKELLALFFCLTSLLAYLKGLTARGGRRFLLVSGSALSYGVALLANQTAITLPFIHILLEYLHARPDERILLKKPRLLAIFLLAAGAYALYSYRWLFGVKELLRIYSKNSFAGSTSYLPLLMADLKAFGFYLYKIVLPVNLAPEYVVRFSESLVQWRSLIGVGLLAATFAAYFMARRSLPVVAIGIGWFLVFYLPVSNIVPVAYMVADRYMYLCLPGVALVVAFLLQKKSSNSLNAGCCVVLAVLAILTVIQNSYWKDEHTLWRHAVKVNPDSTWVRETVALSYLITGELDKARDNAKKAIELDRYNTRAYVTLARTEEKLGNIREAVRYYELFQSFGWMEYPQEVAEIRLRLPYLKEQIK
jgi:protein O-mannosyl-transferase